MIRETIRDSFAERDVAAKAEAGAAGYAAAAPILVGRVQVRIKGEWVPLAVPEYDDPYLTYLWWLGLGQALINHGREVGRVNFSKRDRDGVADGKAGAKTRA